MKITLLGATGATGQWVLRALLDQSHEVIAYVRSPEKMPLTHELLTTIKGDIFDRPLMAKTIEGSDVVISCLGSSTTSKSEELTLMAASIANVMQEVGIPKIVYMSTAGIDNEFKGPMKWFISIILGNVIEDHKNAARVYRHSGLTYVIAKPMQLKDGNPNYQYQISDNGLPKSKKAISRSNVADFLVKAATSQTYDKESLVLAE